MVHVICYDDISIKKESAIHLTNTMSYDTELPFSTLFQ